MNNILTRKLDIRKEMERRASRRLSMLKAFQKEGELNTRQLLTFGPGLSSRLHELRLDGHKIVTVYEKPGLYRYIYLGKPDEDDAKESAVE